MKKKQQTADGAGARKRQQARRDFIKKVGTAAAGAAAVTGALAFKGGDARAQGRPTHDIQNKKIETKPGNVRVAPVEQAGATATVDARTGVIVPNAAAVRLIVERLREKLAASEELKSQFRANPRLVLGSVGLNEDIQTELLAEMSANQKQVAQPGGGGGGGGCNISCVFTCACTNACCVTSIIPLPI